MLNLDDKITFPATATIKLKGLQTSFGIQCRLLDIDVLNDLRKRWTGELATETEPAKPPTIDDREFIDAWLCGFAEDVKEASGEPAPFTPDTVTRLLAKPGAKEAVLNAFFSGYEESEAKNSETPRAG